VGAVAHGNADALEGQILEIQGLGLKAATFFFSPRTLSEGMLLLKAHQAPELFSSAATEFTNIRDGANGGNDRCGARRNGSR
jgi:hypothetical protein